MHVTVFGESPQHKNCLGSFLNPPINADILFFIVNNTLSLFTLSELPWFILENHIDNKSMEMFAHYNKVIPTHYLVQFVNLFTGASGVFQYLL
jgi:hypothetical protein